MAAAEAFRIAYRADDDTLKMLPQHRIDLEAASADYSVRVHPDLLLAAAPRLAKMSDTERRGGRTLSSGRAVRQ
jgi:hypothetical protein